MYETFLIVQYQGSDTSETPISIIMIVIQGMVLILPNIFSKTLLLPRGGTQGRINFENQNQTLLANEYNSWSSLSRIITKIFILDDLGRSSFSKTPTESSF